VRPSALPLTSIVNLSYQRENFRALLFSVPIFANQSAPFQLSKEQLPKFYVVDIRWFSKIPSVPGMRPLPWFAFFPSIDAISAVSSPETKHRHPFSARYQS